MKKSILKSAIITMASIGCFSAVAIGQPMYWSLDHTLTEGSTQAKLKIDNLTGQWEAGFGIFYDLDGSNTIEANEYVELFNQEEEPDQLGAAPLTKEINFELVAGSWELNFYKWNGIDYDLTNVAFDSTVFGVYFEQNSNNTDRIISSDLALFSQNVHPFTLEAELDPTVLDPTDSTWQFSLYNYPYYESPDDLRMQVSMNDLSAIPEPTTMLLFGTGLAGLAGVARRRRK